MSNELIRVRQFQQDDLDAMYRICLLTADGGEDGTHLYSDPELPGHLFMAPYTIFEPSLAFVAEDSEGVGGYIVAALDTAAFERRLEKEWWPDLRARYAEAAPDGADGMSQAERYARHNIHHPWGPNPELIERYPSHLHIDLVPRMQGQGAGRRLIETLVAALRAQGSHGLHLFVGFGNERAPGFYRHVGFTQLPIEDIQAFAMDLASAR